MKKPLVISIFLAIAPLSFAATHNLDGRTLTVDELWAISAPGEKVAVTPEGWARIKASYKAPIDAATDGRDIYGLTVNYGHPSELDGCRLHRYERGRCQSFPGIHQQ